jgi:hypothetical protein
MNFRTKKIASIFMFFTITILVNAQNIDYTGQNEFSIRYEKINFSQENFHSNIKSNINDSLIDVPHLENSGSFTDKLLNLNLFSIKKGNTGFNIDPIISIAPEIELGEGKFYNNYALGSSFSGSFGQKLDFRLNGVYAIRSFPEMQAAIIDSTKSLPFVGDYVSKKNNNYQFYSVTGYLSYSPYQFLNLTLGRGKHFWGDGYRTLFLSDNSAPFPYFNTTVDIWHFKYQWLFGVLSDRNPNFNDNKYRPKFLFAHYLSYNATKWLNLSFFEALVSNPTDSAGLFNLNPAYFNPALFYRPVEFASGSTDNMILGFGFKLKIAKKYQVYGQILIDEFIVSQISSDSAWWGNKYGFQAGLKVFDLFGIKNLFSRIEYNQIRPYTYSYYNSFGNFGNRYQSLAHPLGANFSEAIVEVHYHYKRFSIYSKFVNAKAGTDIDSISYGQDIYKPNGSRPEDYHINQNQGQKGKYFSFHLKLSWILNPKAGLSVFAEGSYQKFDKFLYYSDIKLISLGVSSSLFDSRHHGF